MTIEQLPSGSYRIKQMYNGKRYCVTVPYKPSKKQAIELMAEKLKDTSHINIDSINMTFSEAYTAFIELKSNILSPSTKRGYKSCHNNVSEWFRELRIDDITELDVQRYINEYTLGHSPKSVSNMFGFISVILSKYRHDLNLSGVQLPQKKKNEPYIPTAEDVQRIMAEIKGTKYYVPTCLAALGLRKSEICALTLADLSDDNVITINKALVANENNEYVVKDSNKTTESTRKIIIPADVADIIRSQGYVYRGFPDSITRNLGRVQDRLGIEHFPLHKLRHFFASYAHNELHLSDKQIMEIGGWSSSSTLDLVYKHAMKQQEAKKEVADRIGSLF